MSFPDEEFREYEIRGKIDQVATVVERKEQHEDLHDAPYVFPYWMERMLIPLLFTVIERYPSIIVKGYFCADPKRVGCGVCEKVRLANRIRVQDGRPSWQDQVLCFSCYACLNYCPKEAIQITPRRIDAGSYTTVNGRYFHPWATAAEIAEEKLGYGE